MGSHPSSPLLIGYAVRFYTDGHFRVYFAYSTRIYVREVHFFHFRPVISVEYAFIDTPNLLLESPPPFSEAVPGYSTLFGDC